MTHADDRRLFVFLVLSTALHALWLALPLRTTTTVEAMSPEPLNIHLIPPTPAEKSAMATRHVQRNISSSALRESIAVTDAPIEAPSAKVDLDAALATARSQARDTARPTLDKPRLPVTVEAAIAKATQRDELVETRGANGEYVTRTRNSRCVTPTYVPHFLEGKTMLTQCEALKG